MQLGMSESMFITRYNYYRLVVIMIDSATGDVRSILIGAIQKIVIYTIKQCTYFFRLFLFIVQAKLVDYGTFFFFLVNLAKAFWSSQNACKIHYKNKTLRKSGPPVGFVTDAIRSDRPRTTVNNRPSSRRPGNTSAFVQKSALKYTAWSSPVNIPV